MTTAATIVSKLIVEDDDFDAGMTRAQGATNTFHDNFVSKLKNIGRQISNVGQVMSVGLTLPILAAGTFMVNSASNLEEAVNAVNVVYGESAEIIQEFGENSAEAVGLATSEFNQLASVTGSFLKNLGYDQAAAADETINLTKRAADMASIFGGEVSDALGAIQSALKGEFNPLEQYGVKMNMATIEAKALEMGLADLNGELSDQAKAQAALALIYEQTDQVAGDFANTSGDYANLMRTVRAETTNLASELGTMLLPYVVQGVKYFRELIEKFRQLSPEQQKWILIIIGAVAVLGPLLVVIGSIVGAISALIPVITAVASVMTVPLIVIILAVVAAIALLYVAWTENWGGIQEKTQEAIEFISELFEEAMQFYNDLTTGKLGELSSIWARTTNAIKQGIALWFEQIKLLFRAFKAAFSGDWRELGAVLRQLWDNAWEGMAMIVETAWGNIMDALRAGVNAIKSWWASIDWKKLGTDLVSNIAQGITGALPSLLAAAGDLMDALQEFFTGFFSGGGGDTSDGFDDWHPIGKPPPGGGPGGMIPVFAPAPSVPVGISGNGRMAGGGSTTNNYYQPTINNYYGNQDKRTAMKGLT